MYYTIYQTINKINNRYYIGKHQTKNIYDRYFGSGIALQRAIKKYGKHNFIKEIICICESEQQMNDIEKLIINEEIVNDPNSYNMTCGGDGASCGRTNPRFGKGPNKTSFKKGKYHPMYGKHFTKKHKLNISIALKGNFFTNKHKINIANAKAFNWIIKNPNGIIEKFHNLNQYCRQHNLDPGGLHGVIKGKYKSYKGYTQFI